MLRVIVLGAAAGGGLPQWNCACQACRSAREGNPSLPPQTQSSIAVSADGARWVLVNASPDIRQQLNATPELHPIRAPRSSPLNAVVLTNADVDHIAGLLSLRESQPFTLYATARVLRVLDDNRVFNVLDRGRVERLSLQLDEVHSIIDADGIDTGVRIQPFAVPGKVALWLERPGADGFAGIPEDTIGLAIGTASSRNRLFYMPGCAALPDGLRNKPGPDDSLLFDGTTFTEDEMISSGTGCKSASRMGHLPMSGPEGSLVLWAGVALRRKLFIHINNTNPALLPHSRERAYIRAAGWEIVHDGMEFCVD